MSAACINMKILRFVSFFTSFSAAARASGASRWPPQQTRTVLYSRDTVRVYIRHAYIYAVFSNLAPYPPPTSPSYLPPLPPPHYLRLASLDAGASPRTPLK